MSYSPEETRPPERFLRFIRELLSPEDTATLQEYLGYLLIPSTKAQKMLFLVGQGGEGKSVLGTVIHSLFGESMLTGNYQRIENDRFFRYNLKNKLVMVDDDMQMTALPSTGYLKNLVTANTPIDVEAKGRQSEQALLYTRLLGFGNGSPKALYDKTRGFSRRMLILTTLPIPKDRVPDPHIAEKLFPEKERIFRWMYAGLQRLIEQHYRFTVSEQTKRNLQDCESDSCNIREFLTDPTRVTYGDGLCVPSVSLYESYLRWCGDNALTSLKRDTFISWVRQNALQFGICYTQNISYGGKRLRGFRGLSVTHGGQYVMPTML